MGEKLPWASGLPSTIPKALNPPPQKSLDDMLQVAEKRKLSKPYRRSAQAVREATARAKRIMGEPD